MPRLSPLRLRPRVAALALPALLYLLAPALPAAGPTSAPHSWPDAANVEWTSPSADSLGSMPLGNGDVGANVWVEPSGDLVFYLSKVDAYNHAHLLPKLGRLRLRLDPALPVGPDFRQTLVLREGAITIAGGDVRLRLWIDAHQPVLRLEADSATPRSATLALEVLRPLTPATEPLPAHGTAGVLFDDAPRLAWCYRNQSSDWAKRLAAQNSPAAVARTADPILHRTSGGVLTAPGFVRADPTTLRSATPLTRLECSVRILGNQPADLDTWLAEASRLPAPDQAAHTAWWRAFWDRSHIVISRAGEGPYDLDQCRFNQFDQGARAYAGHRLIDSAQNAAQISQRYALERFCQAAASRGVVPPPYNGSIFTMDMPAGSVGFSGPRKNPATADGRDWANLSFMWQNTRHPLYSMSARGDHDLLRPALDFTRAGLDLAIDRCRHRFNIEGAVINEASWWHNVGVFDWNRIPAHLRYHQLATIELPALMVEHYEHTRDRRFLDEVLLPCVEPALDYYFNRFPARDAAGRMLMSGVGCAETFQGVTNPATEIGALRDVLERLLAFDLDAPRRARFQARLDTLPATPPLRRIRGQDLLAVGSVYDPGREICESPELYSVYPFRRAWLGTPALLPLARQSFHVRTTSLDGTADGQAVETGGWQSAPVQAAYLGLAREAARLVSINFDDRFIRWHDNIPPGTPWPERPRARFPGFWETKMDGTPDNDHGANSVNALQSMLLQNDGDRILLLPAWPEDWNVAFKLHAHRDTTVEGEFRDGRLVSLKVEPASRLRDVVDLSTPAERIRTLVRIAVNDRNYLYDLPPMLDALATPAEPARHPATAAWLTRHADTLLGHRAGPWAPVPWGGAVFRDRIAHVHVLDHPAAGQPLRLPAVPGLRLVSARRVDGDADDATAISTAPDGTMEIRPTRPDPVDTIYRLEFDAPLDSAALALPYAGSLTTGRPCAASSTAEGSAATFATDADGATVWRPAAPGPAWLEVDLGTPRAVGRLELYLEKSARLRAESEAFELEARQPDGAWTPAYQGRVYGTIHGKAFPPVTAQVFRLRLESASAVRQFDLFLSP